MKVRPSFLIEVDVDDMVSNDLEGFLDEISEKAVGNTLLMDISYEFISIVDRHTVLMKVSGDISEVLAIHCEEED